MDEGASRSMGDSRHVPVQRSADIPVRSNALSPTVFQIREGWSFGSCCGQEYPRSALNTYPGTFQLDWDGTFNNTNRPERIVSSDVIAIAAGADHSLFLKSDGSLWGMGRNSEGELGNGTRNNTNKPVQSYWPRPSSIQRELFTCTSKPRKISLWLSSLVR